MSLLTFVDTNPCQFLVNRLRVKAFWNFGTNVKIRNFCTELNLEVDGDEGLVAGSMATPYTL